MEKMYVSVREACATLSVGRSHLYEMMNAGTVESIKLGKRRLITVASLKSLAAATCPQLSAAEKIK